MFTAKDYDKALLTPAQIFELPMEVVNTDSLTTTGSYPRTVIALG